MLVSALITEARDRADIPASGTPETTGRITNPQIRRYMNEALRRSARMSEGLRGEVTKAVVAGTQEYTLSSLTNDIIRIHKVHFTATGDTRDYPLQYWDFASGDDVWGSSRTVNTSSHPQFYWTWNNPPTLELGLYPIPSVAGTLTIRYYRLPTLTSESNSDDSDTIDWPAGWEDVLIDYVAFKMLLQDKQVEAAAVYRDSWAEQLAGFTRATAHHTDEPLEVVHQPHGIMGTRGLKPLRSRW